MLLVDAASMVKPLHHQCVASIDARSLRALSVEVQALHPRSDPRGGVAAPGPGPDFDSDPFCQPHTSPKRPHSTHGINHAQLTRISDARHDVAGAAPELSPSASPSVGADAT